MKADVLIIGGKPDGSTAAMFLLRQGITPVILEQEEFPRFHMGESMTREAAQVMRRFGLAEEMDTMANPVKHGVRVYGTNATDSCYVRVSQRDSDWNLSDSATWQIRRSEFDATMLGGSEGQGCEAPLRHGHPGAAREWCRAPRNGSSTRSRPSGGAVRRSLDVSSVRNWGLE